MGLEVDFISVGEKQKSGDAIAVRVGDIKNNGDQVVIIIDGGNLDSGQELVDHVKEFYGTTKVDLAIATHSDQDHISGLSVVLEKLQVRKLWMHLPWDHSHEIVEILTDRRVTEKSVEEKFWKSLEHARNLYELANEKNIPITEPFAGRSLVHQSLGISIQALGPSLTFYEELLPNFRVIKPNKQSGITGKLVSGALDVIKSGLELWDIETIDDEDTTSAENNSSVILLITVKDKQLLITADAGITALNYAADYADSIGKSLDRVTFLQIPHHGSKRNVGPTILNRIIGPKLASDNPHKIGYISAAKEGEPKHPSKRTTNAFRRRGVSVFSTKGSNMCHSNGAPERPNWSNMTAISFYEGDCQDD